jgi:type IX secretion system PorP/SprF family membrane protein
LEAQDIHWSQFNDNPLFQNPGNAGHFNGDIRFVGNYRDQWRSVTVPFSTTNVSVDGKLYNKRQVGYGLMLFHDVVGDGNFRTVELQGNLSYLIKLTADSMHTIRTGVNIGMNHRQLNFDQFYFDNQYDGIQYNPALSTGEFLSSDRKTNLSIGVGSIYQYYRDKRFNVIGGIGFYNLNRPNQGFYTDVIKRDIRMNLFAQGIFKVHFDWDVLPTISLSVQGKKDPAASQGIGLYRENIIGARAKYTLVDRLGEYRALYGGLFYRNRDAMYLSVGMDYQAWFVGISYDINFSKLVPASRTRGGIEFAVRYVLNRFKPKKIVHRVCPDYI